jgi:hypothetical protein
MLTRYDRFVGLSDKECVRVVADSRFVGQYIVARNHAGINLNVDVTRR